MAKNEIKRKLFRMRNKNVCMVLTLDKVGHRECMNIAEKDFSPVPVKSFRMTKHCDTTAAGQRWWYGIEFDVPVEVEVPITYMFIGEQVV